MPGPATGLLVAPTLAEKSDVVVLLNGDCITGEVCCSGGDCGDHLVGVVDVLEQPGLLKLVLARVPGELLNAHRRGARGARDHQLAEDFALLRLGVRAVDDRHAVTQYFR